MNPPTSPTRRTCDIVMKGGITSGVVYPQAISTLARRYTFINIGGTSAGAIAAAIAAAAEYRRHEDGTDAGFAHLDALPGLLGEKPGGGQSTRLFYFFQPNAGTRRLFEVLTGFLGGGAQVARIVLGRTLKQYASWTVAGSLPGLLLAVASMIFGLGPLAVLWVSLGFALMFVGAVLGAVAGFVLEFIREVPRNGYGLCSGVVEEPGDPGGQPSPAAPGGAEPLSLWLTRYINGTAGREEMGAPLTFGDLWHNGGESDPEVAARRTNLEMMTTNLTHGRPYRLPFRDDEDLRENYRFYFRADEFRRYFPAHVVQWMLAHPREGTDNPKHVARRERLAHGGYYPLPAPADLPLVVATRMSLSFPILLCAVPLHGFVSEGDQEHEEPARCWFSDGGMCSNFPLHFFDAPLPRRPTFSIDLIDKPDGTPPTELHPEMDENNGLLSERWNQFDLATGLPGQTAAPEKPDLQKLLGFFGAMIATMQNWTDTTQARLPGYRDRIVRVPLTAQEGGLNLDMPRERIDALSRRGVEAAGVLMSHFDVPPAHELMTWDNQRWIRLRSLFGALQKTLNNILLVSANGADGDLSFEAWLEAQSAGTAKAPSYPMNPAQITAALETLRALRQIPGFWPEHHPASKNAPRPRPILRPRAQI